MPTKKRAKKQPGPAPAATAKRTKKQPKPAPEPIAKIKKRRRRRRKPVAEPVPLVAEVKSVMHRILESQREQLIQLSEDIQKVSSLAGRRWISAGKKFQLPNLFDVSGWTLRS
jgi:hypothetical protein